MSERKAKKKDRRRNDFVAVIEQMFLTQLDPIYRDQMSWGCIVDVVFRRNIPLSPRERAYIQARFDLYNMSAQLNIIQKKVGA